VQYQQLKELRAAQEAAEKAALFQQVTPAFAAKCFAAPTTRPEFQKRMHAKVHQGRASRLSASQAPKQAEWTKPAK